MKIPFVIVVIFVIVIISVSITLGTNAFDKSQLRKACKVFERESNRETKFVEYTFWRRDCLTPSKEENKWISAFNLRGE